MSTGLVGYVLDEFRGRLLSVSRLARRSGDRDRHTASRKPAQEPIAHNYRVAPALSPEKQHSWTLALRALGLGHFPENPTQPLNQEALIDSVELVMRDTLRVGVLRLVIASTAVSLVFCQQSVPATPLRPAAPVPTPRTLPNKGVVEGGTYKNPSVGIEFKPPLILHLQEPQMKESPDAAHLLISVVADAGTPLPAVGFYAEKLDAYPVDKRGASGYPQRLIRAQDAKGCQRAGAAMTTQLGGVPFLRADCEDGNGHEAVLVATRNAFAFVFILEARDAKEANKLVDSTKVVVAQ